MARKLFAPHFFRGVHPALTEVPDTGGAHYFIKNVMNRPPGLHWVGVYREGPDEVLFDSFGRQPTATNDLKHFVGMKTTETDAEQPVSDDDDMQYCGQACLAFGLVCQRFGMSGAQQI
tara:strand:- start:2287 stop:2640 length:354 start_codon:yes stop_codon:yes gene_type:complete